jgi:hypothetical protein
MKRTYQIRRTIAAIFTLVIAGLTLYVNPDLWQPGAPLASHKTDVITGKAADVLAELSVKGRAPKTGYERSQFGNGWRSLNGCDTRNVILHRDLTHTTVNNKCQITSGTLNDPYTGKTISFVRSADTSADIQIDHVVALGDAWQKGAQQLSEAERENLANDPLELLAVDGPANQQKSDGDAATWLPPNKAFRCQYVARQIAVKKKYQLWVTSAEKDAMSRVLATCPGQTLPSKGDD